MTALRVLITGSRDWGDADTIATRLDELAVAGHRHLVVVHGCAPGADLIADGWARRRAREGWPVAVDRHPADWRRYGTRAGHIRNAAMVALGAHLCLAFINPCASLRCDRTEPHGSHGATGCADLAQRAGIPTQRVERSTTTSEGGN